MLDPAALKRHLTHLVDLEAQTGYNEYGEDQNVFAGRVSCLVDSTSGRRRLYIRDGDAITYQFGITFSNEREIKTGMVLRDARDQSGRQMFAEAEIKSVQPYLDPIRGGVIGFLAYASSRD